MADKQTPEQKAADEQKKKSDARAKTIAGIVEIFQKELETNGYESMKTLFKQLTIEIDKLQIVAVGAHIMPSEPESAKKAQLKPSSPTTQVPFKK